jgi:hypothetical protein
VRAGYGIKMMKVYIYDNEQTARATAKDLNPDYIALEDNPLAIWEASDDAIVVRYEHGRGCIGSQYQWSGLIRGSAYLVEDEVHMLGCNSPYPLHFDETH